MHQIRFDGFDEQSERILDFLRRATHSRRVIQRPVVQRNLAFSKGISKSTDTRPDSYRFERGVVGFNPVQNRHHRTLTAVQCAEFKDDRDAA